MLIDDDANMTKLLKTLLEMDGFEVHVMARGQQAIDNAVHNTFDVFMVDYHLQDMDGITIVHALRDGALSADTPIVMVSGLDVEKEALNEGADAFLIKPFEPEELVDVFMSLING